MKWHRVYIARFLTEAERVRELMIEGGLHPQLRGAMLASAAGELPIQDALPTLWVSSEEKKRAEQFIERLDAELMEEEGVWSCSFCDAEVPGHFGTCWSCATATWSASSTPLTSPSPTPSPSDRFKRSR